jgi:hypothetical protein
MFNPFRSCELELRGRSAIFLAEAAQRIDAQPRAI